MEHSNCVICSSPAVEIPYSVSLVKWERMWTNFHKHLPSTIISNICLNKILMYDNVSFCKECFDSSLELSSITETIANLIHEQSRVIDETLNGILQRANDSHLLLNPNVKVETKKSESCEDSKDSVVVESNTNNETINIEEDINSQRADSAVDVQTNQENPIVETRPVLLMETETDPRNISVERQSSVIVSALTPHILLRRVPVEINESNETTHLLEKSGSNNALGALKPQSFTKDGKVKERKQAHNHTTGKSPKAAYKKRTVRKNSAGHLTKKQEKKRADIFKCQLCYTMLKSQKNLEIHITKVHNGQKLSSSLKGRPSATNCPAASSQQSGNRRNGYKCFFCVKRFSNIEQRTAHHEEIHDKKGRAYECSVCGKTFGLKNTLLTHQLTHIGDRR